VSFRDPVCELEGVSKHKSENPKPTFDLVLGFEIDYQCESSYFNLVRESKHRKSKTEVRGSASPGYCIGLVRIVPEVWWKDVVDDEVFIIFTRDLPSKLDLFCSSSTPFHKRPSQQTRLVLLLFHTNWSHWTCGIPTGPNGLIFQQALHKCTL
jgi:hypothetical protein